MNERSRLLGCAAICAGVAALAGCGGDKGGDVKFDSPAYKTGYDCGSGDTGKKASTIADAIESCRSLAVDAGHAVTPKSDFDNGVTDGWHVQHGF